MCEGFCAVDVAPSPSPHSQEVGLLVDVSVKFTVRGVVPELGDILKDATGAGIEAITADVVVCVPVPVLLVAFSVTLYVPGVV